MVAHAINCDFFNFWIANIFNKWLCSSAIYLHLVLMNREKSLETIIVLALASLVAALWLDMRWLIYLSIGFLTISLISKKLTFLIGTVWFTFSEYFGIVMNYVIMFIIFYLFLCPISFFQRLFGGNQILKKSKNNSHFIQRNHLYSDKDIKYPW